MWSIGIVSVCIRIADTKSQWHSWQYLALVLWAVDIEFSISELYRVVF